VAQVSSQAISLFAIVVVVSRQQQRWPQYILVCPRVLADHCRWL